MAGAYVSAIASPVTAMLFASSGRVAGPVATVPSRLKLLPWHGQLIAAPTTSDTEHPAWVQTGEKQLNRPGEGWVSTTASGPLPTITPEPTGTSEVLAMAATGTGVVSADPGF